MTTLFSWAVVISGRLWLRHFAPVAVPKGAFTAKAEKKCARPNPM